MLGPLTLNESSMTLVLAAKTVKDLYGPAFPNPHSDRAAEIGEDLSPDTGKLATRRRQARSLTAGLPEDKEIRKCGCTPSSPLGF